MHDNLIDHCHNMLKLMLFLVMWLMATMYCLCWKWPNCLSIEQEMRWAQASLSPRLIDGESTVAPTTITIWDTEAVMNLRVGNNYALLVDLGRY